MNPTADSAIWRALRKRVQSFASVMAVRLPGEGKGTPTGAHVLVTVIGVAPSRLVIADGQPHVHRGTLQLVLRHQLENLNYTKTREDAGLWAQHFVDGTCMRDNGVKIKVYEQPEVGDGFNEGGWWNTPIRIRWETAA